MIEYFDIIEYLEDKDIEYRTSGPNVTLGWIEINCPWCDDPSFHLGINLDSKLMNCWRCGPKGSVINLIQEIEGCNRKEAYEILKKYIDPEYLVDTKVKQKVTHTDELKLPKTFTKLLPRYRRYLYKRGFNPKFIERNFKILGGGEIGKWKNRIIIPVFYNHRLVTWTARDITDKSKVRYKHLSKEKSIIPCKETLYNIDKVYKGSYLVIVEGPLDVWKLFEYEIRNCVCCFGTNLTDNQIKILLEKEPKNITIIFDPDAKEKAEKEASKLNCFFNKIRVVYLDGEADVAELPEQDIRFIRELVRR